MRAAALAAYKAGLCILPTATDGTKAPGVRPWGQYKAARPSAAELKAWHFDRADGFGVVAGAVSGHVECWDIDDAATCLAFEAATQVSGLGAVWFRLTTGYLDRTPGGGWRVLVRYPDDLVFTDCTLARRPGGPGEPAIKTLIEFPTFAIVAPSNGRTHPSGGTYTRLSGGFESIASYSGEERQALITLARTFDQVARPAARVVLPPSNRLGTRPGDDYNRRMTWSALLEPNGWVPVFEREQVTYWRRPGKTYGVSATTNYGGTDLFYPFTSSSVFEADRSYSKFGVLTLLEYGGDFGKAALALLKAGYGADLDEVEPTTTHPTTEPRIMPTNESPRTLRLTAANTIVMRPVCWLWESRLPVGSFGLIGGREGVGKSVLAYTLAASVTQGKLPGRFHGVPKGVIVAATEDSWAHTINPRLVAAGADLARVHRADIVDVEGLELPLSLPKDTTALLQGIREVDAALVILDPLLSRLDSRLDSHKDADVRRALEPLAAMADAGCVTVLGLIHVNKSASVDALSLLMASRAFAAVARSVLFVAVNPDNEQQRLVSTVKNNLGRLDLPTLLFEIRGSLVATTADGDDIWTGKLMWTGESNQPLRDVLQRTGEREDDTMAWREAEEWLVDYLTSQGGTAAKKTIVEQARQAGHSLRTLTRARQHAGILPEGRGFPRQSYWLMPPSSLATNSVSVGAPDGGPTERAEEQLGHKLPVGPGDQGRQTVGSTDEDGVAPAGPPSVSSPERGPTGARGPTAPALFDEESDTGRRWQQTDEAFKKGWQ